MPYGPEDREGLIRYLNDPEIYRNTLRVPYPYTAQDADEWLVHTHERTAQLGRTANWAIRHREAGYIGGVSCFFKTGVEGHCDEIGYALAAPWRGQGLMTEVVTAFSAWLFDTRPALARLEANVFPHNPASVRVLEKAGYEREGYLRCLHLKEGELLDAIVMAKIRTRQ